MLIPVLTIETFSAFRAQGWISGSTNLLDLDFHLESNGERFHECQVTLKVSTRTDLAFRPNQIYYDVAISTRDASASIRHWLSSLSTSTMQIIDSVGTEYKVQIWRPCKAALDFLSLTDREVNVWQKIIEKNASLPLSSSIEYPIGSPPNESKSDQRSLCAVITYAHGNRGWWQYFKQHYTSHVGHNTIYVVTPKPADFWHEDVAGIIGTHDSPYDESMRSNCISRLADSLRPFFQYIIVCDVDEIIVPPPVNGRTPLLSEYLSSCPSTSIIWSMGIDVIGMDEDPPFDFTKGIRSQRRYGIYNSSISKPHITARSISYSGGYHYCNFSPSNPCVESSLYLHCFHLKYACSSVRNSLHADILDTDYQDSQMKDYAASTLSKDHCHLRLATINGSPVPLGDSKLQQFHEEYLLSIKEVDDRGFFVSDFRYFDYLVDLS
ncbi:hypothetical protein [Synechococcus sp. CS-1332]|uniref:hypothetical protein n=1 Tax=Synechococcus sp. CS-1332 TaxID=2847972 RepID=UPI00223ADBA1|nr:hypothetical protein [Synechococcus sp. CS-1332]MCT0206135.1 hypothetical protein [Synechococcus sp. CS-1332]